MLAIRPTPVGLNMAIFALRVEVILEGSVGTGARSRILAVLKVFGAAGVEILLGLLPEGVSLTSLRWRNGVLIGANRLTLVVLCLLVLVQKQFFLLLVQLFLLGFVDLRPGEISGQLLVLSCSRVLIVFSLGPDSLANPRCVTSSVIEKKQNRTYE